MIIHPDINESYTDKHFSLYITISIISTFLTLRDVEKTLSEIVRL